MLATNNSAKMLKRCPHSVAGVERQIKNLRLALLGTTICMPVDPVDVATVSRSLSSSRRSASIFDEVGVTEKISFVKVGALEASGDWC